MKALTLKTKDIQILSEIQKNLSEQQYLTEEQQNFLSNFIANLPSPNFTLIERTPLDELCKVIIWDMEEIQSHLHKWEKLFSNLPGWDYSPLCIFYDGDAVDQLKDGIIMAVVYAPSMSYNIQKGREGYEVHLKDDGTAKFWFPNFEDAEQYPELYNFKGSWKEAYYLLVEILKKGWPMEEFPEELLPLLKK